MSLTKDQMKKVNDATVHTSGLLTELCGAMRHNQMAMKVLGSDDLSCIFKRVSSLLCVTVASLTAVDNSNPETIKARDMVFLLNTEDMMKITNQCVAITRDALCDKDMVNPTKLGDMRDEIISHYDAYLNFVVPWMTEMDAMHKKSLEAIDKYDKDHGEQSK